MNRAYRKELMKTHWLVQFGFCIIPESWYAKNDRAVKKKQSIEMRIGVLSESE